MIDGDIVIIKCTLDSYYTQPYMGIAQRVQFVELAAEDTFAPRAYFPGKERIQYCYNHDEPTIYPLDKYGRCDVCLRNDAYRSTRGIALKKRFEQSRQDFKRLNS